MNKYLIPLFFWGAIVIGIGLIIVTFLFGIKPNKDKEEQVRIQAELYLEDNFNEYFEVYDTLFDNMGNFDSFEYAAKAFDRKNHTQFLIYYDDETKQMVDTYIADKWEDDLKTEISPFIKVNFGESSDFHVFFTNETIGNELGIDPINPKSYTAFDVAPTIRITLPRKKSNEDDKIVNEFISFLQSEVKLQSGSVIIEYIAENGVNLDDEWSKEF
ncbi:hypothetical protein AC622_03230 [Bacillus sp. FJAT-27916]|uniref:hypothetical protein n=1 Tax=Bacillus sp. FJAT-27916 TaxID=1679169 RepID=UPI00067094EF|nr:hypothetical protein [Bacillus sp. FJAT-27916]KMY43387.1 hypothetical protein AC622_03230 [Bacillus sp. FJAT-27916]